MILVKIPNAFKTLIIIFISFHSLKSETDLICRWNDNFLISFSKIAPIFNVFPMMHCFRCLKKTQKTKKRRKKQVFSQVFQFVMRVNLVLSSLTSNNVCMYMVVHKKIICKSNSYNFDSLQCKITLNQMHVFIIY